MKPHLRLYRGLWRCSGTRELVHAAGMSAYYYPFPWGYGATWQGAYAAWKKLQRTAGRSAVVNDPYHHRQPAA